MARIVPARPRCDSDAEEAALLALETGLDDAFVVIQRRPSSGSMIVAHPDMGTCALRVVDGVLTFDADLDEWVGADLVNLAATGKQFLAPVTDRCVAVVMLTATPRPVDGPQDPRVAFLGETGSLPSIVTSALTRSRPIGDAGVQALIQSVAPGAGNYVPGQITAAQEEWRTSMVALLAPNGEDAAVSAVLPAITSWSPDTKDMIAVSDANPEVFSFANPVVGQNALVAVEADRASVVALVGAAIYEEVSDEHPIILLLRQAAETVVRGRLIYVAGVAITVNELTSTDFLLPALLVAAAEDWAPVVASREGKGGFLVRLRTNNESILGYKVVALDPSAPLLMLLPVIDRIRRFVRVHKGVEEITMDDTVNRFRIWLEVHRFDTSAVSEIDLRVALGIG